MEKKIRTVLVDDEKNSLIIMQRLLEKHTPQVEIVATAQSVAEGIEVINEHNPELVFLDISMPDGDGFEVIEKVESKDFQVIFSTAYDQYAIRAFEVAALHYILKPVKPEDLVEALARFEAMKAEDITEKISILSNALKETPTRLILPTSNGMHVIEVQDIVRCESSNNYTTFYFTDKKKIVVSKSIQIYEQLLESSNFCRIHNKHLVNLKYIKKYVKGRGGYVILHDDSHVDVSDGRKKTFLDKLSEYALKS
ncbi:MAG: response regulator transcription factor [Bacteroidales bacterium]|nr:response regulator transcription factor [Bacteroidales bacterium]